MKYMSYNTLNELGIDLDWLLPANYFLFWSQDSSELPTIQINFLLEMNVDKSYFICLLEDPSVNHFV